MSKAFIILGNQLFNLKFYKPYKDYIFYMAEDFALCTYKKHHKHKIIFFLSSMRSFKDELVKENFNIFYRYSNDIDFKENYEQKLKKFIKANNISFLSFFEIEDKKFELKILKFLDKLKIKYAIKKSPMFLSSRDEFKSFLSKNKKPLMANFYKEQRIKFKILVDEYNKPKFGKWSFDKENRKKIPKNFNFPKQPIFKKSNHTIDVINFTNDNFADHIGSSNDFWIGTTREDAWKCFNNFLSNKFENFGDFEDAVSQKDNILFHSAISPFINLGLITPREIINKLHDYQSSIKINSYEGFLRQIIGWREFMRGVYQNYDQHFEKSNFFNHQKKMKDSWYRGTTGLVPLDYSIKNSIKFGWTHHIERLMILANIMNLCEINPNQVYDWFMEMFIDSSEWVMSPNVYGMGLFSDGGVFSTKPYICGSSYFLKMMDFKKDSWCEILDGLYWRFIDKNRSFFKKNPRLSMMVHVLDKMKDERREKIFDTSQKFIEKNTW